MSSPPLLAASRAAHLVDGFARDPAYAGLAEALTLLIGDGRIAAGTRLPSERDLTAALGVSRTTVTRAYAALCESGYAEARRGAGTFTAVPRDRARAHDRVLSPRDGRADVLDLGCAASTAPPQLAAAYAEAVADLPAFLGGTGYFPTGVPDLQAALARHYEARGLPTAPEQVVVTSGALAATAVVAQAVCARGDRVLVETPTYPNAVAALRAAGARPVAAAVDPHGWDLGEVAAALRRGAPRAAYLVPDFHNPTGLLMDDAQRAEHAALLRRSGTVAVVDEAHQALALDPGLAASMPRPYAAHSPDALSLGSASKAWWGGLRLGWVRVPADRVDAVIGARLALDLGAPVLEQLVLVRLLEAGGGVLEAHRARLREQRDALVAAVSEQLPSWRWRRPEGGLALWCELPAARATALCAEAERAGVVVSPGPVFAAEGGLDRYVRVPWVRPVEELRTAVQRLAVAWERVEGGTGGTPRDPRVMVA